MATKMNARAVNIFFVLMQLTLLEGGIQQRQYIGCYQDKGARDRAMKDQTTSANMTTELCSQRCNGQRATFFGVQNSNECFCGHKYDKHGQSNNCTKPCSGNIAQICGGGGALSVYTVCPVGRHGPNCNSTCPNCRRVHTHGNQSCYFNGTCLAGCEPGWTGRGCKKVDRSYIGCYRDTNLDRSMGEIVRNNVSMTVEMCSQECNAKHMTFFGVQFSSECFCGDQYYKHGPADRCNMTCGGNSSQICGGAEANSVYRVCPLARFGPNCLHTCPNCRYNESNGQSCYFNGTCLTGCKSVWTGGDCNEDVDECEEHKGGCQHRCINTAGSYYCSCWTGYTLNSDNKSCDDVDECQTNNGGCSHNCENTEGRYRCTCPPGYKLRLSNGRQCADIDECQENKTVCSQHCVNTKGTYTCYCSSGYSLDSDKRTCSDIDECTSASTNDCTQNCTNTAGSYTCSCQLGFALEADNRTCIDVDECVDNNGGCRDICSNTNGSRNCGCYLGYELNSDDKSCSDVNECATETHGCQHKCTNTGGSYNCSCEPDFELHVDGRNCNPRPSNLSSTLAVGMGSCVSVLAVLCAAAAAIILVFRRKRTKRMDDNNHRPLYVEDRNVNEYETAMDNLRNNNIEIAEPTGTSEQRASETITADNPIYANFNTDSRNASKTCVLVTDLPTLVQRINQMPEYLKAEYKKLEMTSGAKHDFALKPELKNKNRFKNILPYDENRVKLSKLNDDPLSTYINASFIRGYYEHEKLIASHGPTTSTTNDFWKMIWEFNVGAIVMVTKCVEEMKMKCEQYWPTTCIMDFGDIRTEPTSIEVRPDRAVRKYNVSKTGQPTRLLTQIQFTDWPDHGVPEHAVSLLAIRHAVKRIVPHDQYIVVHCSAGVGRTGTYLAIDYLLSQAAEEGFVDVHSCVKQLRAQRMHSVQTLDQYSFIFKALLEGLTLGETTLSLAAFRDRVFRLHNVNPMTKKSFVETEFQMLQEMQPIPAMSYCSDALDVANCNKNRNTLLLPVDSERLRIMNITQDGTDYINAVCVPSFMRKNAYISTQLPLSTTVGDFWNMCVDYNVTTIVFLGTIDSTDEIWSFLPKFDEPLQFGKTWIGELNEVPVREKDTCQTLTVVTSRTAGVGQKTIAASDDHNIYANTQINDSEQSNDFSLVTVVHVTLPDSPAALRHAMLQTRNVLGRISKGNGNQSPTVIMSRDGVAHCGQFIAVCNLCDMINTQQEVDVFQTVYNIKRTQPHFFTSMADYEELFMTIQYVADQTSHYYNS